MGQEEVPGHVEAGGDGRAEQEGGGLEQGGAEAASINLRKNLDGTDQTVNVFTNENLPAVDTCYPPKNHAEKSCFTFESNRHHLLLAQDKGTISIKEGARRP